jgi:hypothetical protein
VLKFSPDENPILEPELAIKWFLYNINKKFTNKFGSFWESFPNTEFAIFVSVIKADDISLHLRDITKIKKLPIIITNKNSSIHPKLKYATAVRFQENNNNLEVVHLIDYKVV